MKKLIYNIVLLAVLAIGFTACEKEETRVVFDAAAATYPTLKMSATSVKCDPNKLTDDAVTFDVSKASYGNVQTPVAYSVVITLPIKDGKPKEKVFSLTADKLTKKLNIEELNDIFIFDFEQEGGKIYKVNVEAVANPGTAYALKSKIAELTVDTYPF